MNKNNTKEFDFAIAYADKVGKDFAGIPWVLDDIDGEEECISKSLEMIANGFQKVIPFKFDRNRKKPEELSWTYVKRHQI